MVYAEFYHGLRLQIPKAKPEGFIASNHGKILHIPWFGGRYSYSNMTKQLKYLKFPLYFVKNHAYFTNIRIEFLGSIYFLFTIRIIFN